MPTMKMIDINEIAANPYRNFDIYPMDNKQVESLMESYGSAEDFGVLPVRRSEYAEEAYEQACGHHRLEAMRELGYEKVRVIIGQYDDDEMVKIMALENAKQKGDNAPAQLDALAGIAQRVAFMLLIDEECSEFSELISGVTAQAWKKSRTQMLNGNGISHQVISGYVPGMWKSSMLGQLLTTLKDSGEMAKIVERVQAEVKEIQDAEAEAEAQERARQEALAAKAEREQKLAEKRAKEAAESAKKAKAAQKQAAEARAAEEKKRAEAMAKARAKAAEQEKKRREVAAKEAESRRKQMAEAAAAKAAFAEKSRGLNPEVLHLLKRDDHLETFRKLVTSDKGRRHFPRDGQPELVRELIASTSRLTSRYMEEFMADRIAQGDAELQRMLKEQRLRDDKASVKNKVDNRVDEFKGAVSAVNRTLLALGKLLEDDKTAELAFYTISTDSKLVSHIDSLEQLTARLRTNLGLRRSLAAQNRATNDEVISVQ